MKLHYNRSRYRRANLSSKAWVYFLRSIVASDGHVYGLGHSCDGYFMRLLARCMENRYKPIIQIFKQLTCYTRQRFRIESKMSRIAYLQLLINNYEE